MPTRPRDPFTHGPVDNDPLTANQVADESTWSLPSDEGLVGQHPAQLPPLQFDYAAGILVGHGEEADAQPISHPHLVGALTNAPHSFELPHEATHRRYEPPFIVPVNQAAAGFTLIAAARGLHFAKVIAAQLTLDAGGTFKWVQGSNDGTSTGDLSGALSMGGAATSPMSLSPADLQNPWLFTAPSQALGIFTATGKAQGWVVVCYSPYDS
jgi:hypothetical protein